MVGELLAVVERLEGDNEIATVVLRGAGGSFSSGGLDSSLDKLLQSIGRCAPKARAATKRILLDSLAKPRDTLLDEAADAFATCLRGEEGREGVSAFLEKRPTRWADAAK